ncbi:MAG TPA: NAD(P)-binding domain-containing protein [Dongiaceae bacterium]|nr:NAD(P)-binding domain-containing protein [Dongiaceae bacterium]
MRIGVTGAGWLGGTVGARWVKAGHEVLFSTRHPERLKNLPMELGANASIGTVADAAAFGPVVLIATPYEAVEGIGHDHRQALHGKIVLDATNSWPSDTLADETAKNGVGLTSARLLAGTRLVRAFSAVDATAVDASAAGGRERLAVPLAGDDREAIDVAVQLVRDAGCDPLVVGDLAAGRSFERHGPGFRANTALPKLRRLLQLPGSS